MMTYTSKQHRRVVLSVICMVTDACLTADQGVASSVPAQPHTFVENDHEIIYMVIILPSADFIFAPLLTLIQEGLLSVTSKTMRNTG